MILYTSQKIINVEMKKAQAIFIDSDSQKHNNFAITSNPLLMMDMNKDMNSCGCMHHKTVPLFITLFGIMFLLGNLNVITPQTVSIVWPSLLILGGLMKMFSGMCKCCKR